MHPNNIPPFIHHLFLLVFCGIILFFSRIFSDPENRFNHRIGFFTFLYFGYISILSWLGLLQVNTIPPAIMKFGFFPALIILFLLFHFYPPFKQFMLTLPIDRLIRFHQFRLIGFVFIILWHFHQLPASFAFPTAIGDIVVALATIPLLNHIRSAKSTPIHAIYIWNIVGCVDMILVLINALRTTFTSIQNGTQGILILAEFPYCFIPAIAPASVLFMHYVLWKKTKLISLS